MRSPIDISLPFSERMIEKEFQFGENEIRCLVFRYNDGTIIGSAIAQYV
jgi:hypothetical protein